MNFPDFFSEVPAITVRDNLADFLGAASGGILTYHYTDAVKLAGHSCPTVASAYGLACRALQALYGEEIPERGRINVAFRKNQSEGVTGVQGSIIGLLTGAAGEGGFKGLAGQFSRCNRRVFGRADLPLEVRFIREDTGEAVDAAVNLAPVPGDPAMGELMQRCLSGLASAEEQAAFAGLWQDRVRRILLEYREDPSVFVLRKVG